MLFLKSQFKVFQLDDFLLVIMDGLAHTVFLTLDHKKFHLDSLLDI